LIYFQVARHSPPSHTNLRKFKADDHDKSKRQRFDTITIGTGNKGMRRLPRKNPPQSKGMPFLPHPPTPVQDAAYPYLAEMDGGGYCHHFISDIINKFE
jgi:hypothetical protein